VISSAHDKERLYGSQVSKNLRKYERLEWNRAGTILQLSGERICVCFVMDISPSGARVAVNEPDLIPDYFRLDYGAGQQPKCSVKWRKSKQIGVQFLLKS
jgi:hypothetical protein